MSSVHEEFKGENAKNYTKNRVKMAAIKESLHFCMRMVLAELPTDAHMLCVGAGTGDELLALADAFPSFRFAVIEPSADMMQVCKENAEEKDISSRCIFHEGYLDSYDVLDTYDGATSILVSQFCQPEETRQAFFQEIYHRLKPGGLLITADLCADTASASFESMFKVWSAMLLHSGVPEEKIEHMRELFGTQVSVIPEPDMEQLLKSCGFDDPIRFFQNLLIHAWYTRKG